MKAPKEHKPQQSRLIQPIQRIRNKEMDITPEIQVMGATIWGWSPCVLSEIVIPPNVKPKKGTETAGKAPWDGNLFDNGYRGSRNATRLHVINSNFGGLGGNYDNNLHPGSQQLNKNHLMQGENVMKSKLADSKYDNSELTYKCYFNWNRTIISNNHIEDPQIQCRIVVDYNKGAIEDNIINISKGPGMTLKSNISSLTDDDSTDDD